VDKINTIFLIRKQYKAFVDNLTNVTICEMHIQSIKNFIKPIIASVLFVDKWEIAV
jgi:hypothetical protein